MATLSDSFLKTSVADPQDERGIVRLVRFLETRIEKRDLLQEDLQEKQNHFRNILVELEHENESLRYDNNEQRKLISVLEGRICKLQNNIDGLLYKLNDACDAIRDIQEELKDKDKQLKQYVMEKQKIIQKCDAKIEAEIGKMAKKMQMKLQEQRERLTSYIKKKEEKMRLVKQILTLTSEDTSDNVTLTPPIASSSRLETVEKANLMSKKDSSMVSPINFETSKQFCDPLFFHAKHSVSNGKTVEKPSIPLLEEKSFMATFIDSQTSESDDQVCQTSFYMRGELDVQNKTTKEPIPIESFTPSISKTKIVEKPKTTAINSPSSSMSTSSNTTVITKIKSNTKIPIVNPRYQRMQNVDRWIDHRPIGIVPTGTILQPRSLSYKRTIRKLTNPKDLVAKSSRYCLFSQEQDTDGELETKLYKADVLPTCGGGAQIVFNDIECLKQMSPTAVKNVLNR